MDNSNDRTQAPLVSPESQGGLDASRAGRRRLLRGGLLGAPTLLALKSSPVLAANCKLPSGFTVSGNLSRTGSNNCGSQPARLPSAWYLNTGSTYPNTTVSKNTWFSSVFTLGTYTDRKFNDALALGNTNEQALIVAIYLEAAAAGGGGVGIPNLQMVKDMWNLGIASPTGYKPLSSMPTLIWHKPEVIKYLLYLTNQAPAV